MHDACRIAFFFLVFFTISGCGSSGGSNEGNEIPDWCLIQYSTDTTFVGASGTRLEPSSNMYVTPEEVEWFYQEVRACAAQTYPEIANVSGPSVRYESFSEAGSIAAMGGYTTSPYSTALVNTDDPIGRRSCYSDKWTLKHEFLHHLIYVGGLPLLPYPDDHPAAGYPNPHATKLFALEADGGCMPVLIDASLP